MALLGQGDPRWKVEDRKDGRNCNAWHWTERDCTKWCTAKLTEKLLGFELCSFGGCKVEKVEKIAGEVTYCNRKRKHMFFYDLEINIAWVAGLGDKKITGNYRVPSVCDDDPITERTVRISTTMKSAEGDLVIAALKKEGTERLIKLFNSFMEDAKTHFKEPLPDEIEAAGGVVSKSAAQSAPAPEPAKPEPEKPKSTSSKDFKSISMKLQFDCSPELMYECLMDDRRVSAFTQSPAQMERKNGGNFNLFGGQIEGTNKELVANEKIVQSWRFKSWPANHFSTVTIKLSPSQGGTKVELEQTRVPIDDFERTKSGWNSHFWTRIRATFGFPFHQL